MPLTQRGPILLLLVSNLDFQDFQKRRALFYRCCRLYVDVKQHTILSTSTNNVVLNIIYRNTVYVFKFVPVFRDVVLEDCPRSENSSRTKNRGLNLGFKEVWPCMALIANNWPCHSTSWPSVTCNGCAVRNEFFGIFVVKY